MVLALGNCGLKKPYSFLAIKMQEIGGTWFVLELFEW